MPEAKNNYDPDVVLTLWYPDDGFELSLDSFRQWIQKRMYGGMDEIIRKEYAQLTMAAARGQLDHWSQTPRGRVALLLALDQFPRSLWRDTPGAYGQDIKAALVAIEGINSGHYRAVAPWEKFVYILTLGHCEGPDHLQRLGLMDRITEEFVAQLPPVLAPTGDRVRSQNAQIRSVIERFGRHPHRNQILGRISTPAEEEYIAAGDFPHVNKAPLPEGAT